MCTAIYCAKGGNITDITSPIMTNFYFSISKKHLILDYSQTERYTAKKLLLIDLFKYFPKRFLLLENRKNHFENHI